MSSVNTKILSQAVSKSIYPPTFYQTISEETHEFLWCIPNHDAVTSDIDSLFLATRSFSFTSHNMIDNWELGYNSDGNQHLTPYLKFLSPSSKAGDIVPLQWLLFAQSETESGWTLASSFIPKISKSIAGYPDNSITVSVACALNCPDVNGTQIWKSQLVVQIKNGPPSATLTNFSTSSISQLQQNMALLLERGDGDLKIICSDGAELRAHKLIFSCQNSVLTSMLTDKMVDDVVQVKDICSGTMKILLRYLYTGALPEEWSQPEYICEFTYAAGKYKLEEILKLLDESLESFYHEENNLVRLLVLVQKLGLTKAEMELMQRVREIVNRAETAKEFVRIMKN